MSKLFPAKIQKKNCTNTSENLINSKHAVTLEEFGTKYIAEGDIVYKITTEPMAQWELKWDLEYSTEGLVGVCSSIDRLHSRIDELKTNSDCSWYAKEKDKLDSELATLEKEKEELEFTISFCNLYLLDKEA